MNRVVVGLAVVAAVALSVLGMGLAMEMLGDWTDAHRDRMTLVWAIWDLLVLAVAAVLVWQWMRYRRERKDSSAA